jgi:D-tyrosyl-tRNA(Tyr) deacylase
MRVVVQRVSGATVTVDGREVGRCGYGLMLLVAVHRDDDEAIAVKAADRVAKLRIFNDETGKMNRALVDFAADPDSGRQYEHEVLAVSNFTVYGDAAKSRRPSFTESAPYEQGRALFDRFVGALRELGVDVQTGVFGANMQVALLNDGPVTLILDIP